MQIAMYMAMNVNEFSHHLSKFLRKNELTFEGYVMAVARGHIRCDHYVLLAITGMWNISITIVSPAYTTEWKVHHNSVDPRCSNSIKWSWLWFPECSHTLLINSINAQEC